VFIGPAFAPLAYPMLRAHRVSEVLGTRVVPSHSTIKRLIGVVVRAAISVALLVPWLAILAWLYSRPPW